MDLYHTIPRQGIITSIKKGLERLMFTSSKSMSVNTLCIFLTNREKNNGAYNLSILPSCHAHCICAVLGKRRQMGKPGRSLDLFTSKSRFQKSIKARCLHGRYKTLPKNQLNLTFPSIALNGGIVPIPERCWRGLCGY